MSKIIDFLERDGSAGFVLAFASLLALVLANSYFSSQYFYLIHLDFFGLSLQHWINDGLMTIFFFVVGIEIKKGLLLGELSSPKKASLPIAAAVGGMLFPALVYLYFNPSGVTQKGWGIPMATDIAFCLGVLSLFGSRVSNSIKMFLLTLAIVDDLGAILVIALFYTNKIESSGLLLAGFTLALVLLARFYHMKSYSCYFVLGLIAWGGVLLSGVHATLAGVILGFMTPLKFPVQRGSTSFYSPANELIKRLHIVVGFLIIPLFAFFNSGVDLRSVDMASVISNQVFQGITLGLVIGKPIGIMVFIFLALYLKLGVLPDGVKKIHLIAISFLGGIGFTVSIFISNLALPKLMDVYSKSGIILGSTICGVIGVGFLGYSLCLDKRTKL